MAYDINSFLKLVEERQDELVDILRDLVKIDSQSFNDGTGREEAVANHLAEVFKGMGVEPDVFSPLDVGIESHPDYLDGRHLENRYNCAAVFPGTDHSHRILLTGHEDTVTIGDPKLWERDPFGGEVADGKLYGRGSGDDKSGIAVPIYLMKLMKEAGIQLPYDVVVAGYSDEENGGSNGALALNLKYPCDEAFNLDGCHNEIVCGGAGGGIVRVSLVSDDICDSCATICEAFTIFRDEMAQWAKDRKAEFETHDLFAGTIIPDTTVRYTDVRSGWDGSAMGRLETLITFYTTNDEKATREQWAEVEKRFNERAKELHVHIESWEMITRFFHFVETDTNSKAVKLLQESIKAVTGETKEPIGMCLSDFPMFTLYGSPTSITYGCGLAFDEVGGAHQFNEFIHVKDLVDYAKTIAYFLLNYKF